MRQLKITKQFTTRESDSLIRYLSEIGKEKLLSTKEEVDLIILIKQGDSRALEKLVKSNLRFVVSVAKQYQNEGMMLGDLINEGNLGLIKAAHRFDETRGFKFITYAVWWIRQCILQALVDQSRLVKLPYNKVGMMNKIKKANLNLTQEFEREPTDEELAHILDVSVEEISSTVKYFGWHVSLDSSDEQGGEAMIDGMACPISGPVHPINDLIYESLQHEISRMLKILPPKEADVTKLFFGIGGETLSLEEIGDRYDISREGARQIKEKALRRIRGNKNSMKLLKMYLG